MTASKTGCVCHASALQRRSCFLISCSPAPPCRAKFSGSTTSTASSGEYNLQSLLILSARRPDPSESAVSDRAPPAQPRSTAWYKHGSVHYCEQVGVDFLRSPLDEMNEIFKTRKQKESKRCSNRKMKQHKVSTAGYIFCYLAKVVPVTPFSVLCKQEQLTFRELQVAEKTASAAPVSRSPCRGMVRNGEEGGARNLAEPSYQLCACKTFTPRACSSTLRDRCR